MNLANDKHYDAFMDERLEADMFSELIERVSKLWRHNESVEMMRLLGIEKFDYEEIVDAIQNKLTIKIKEGDTINIDYFVKLARFDTDIVLLDIHKIPLYDQVEYIIKIILRMNMRANLTHNRPITTASKYYNAYKETFVIKFLKYNKDIVDKLTSETINGNIPKLLEVTEYIKNKINKGE